MYTMWMCEQVYFTSCLMSSYRELLPRIMRIRATKVMMTREAEDNVKVAPSRVNQHARVSLFHCKCFFFICSFENYSWLSNSPCCGRSTSTALRPPLPLFHDIFAAPSKIKSVRDSECQLEWGDFLKACRRRPQRPPWPLLPPQLYLLSKERRTSSEQMPGGGAGLRPANSSRLWPVQVLVF